MELRFIIAGLQVLVIMFSQMSFSPGVLPYMGYINMCCAKGYGFSAALVINRVSILAILVINRLSIFAL